MPKIIVEKSIVEGAIQLHALLVIASKAPPTLAAWIQKRVEIFVPLNSIKNLGRIDPPSLGNINMVISSCSGDNKEHGVGTVSAVPRRLLP